MYQDAAVQSLLNIFSYKICFFLFAVSHCSEFHFSTRIGNYLLSLAFHSWLLMCLLSRLTLRASAFLSHHLTVILSLHTGEWVTFTMETQCRLCETATGFLHIIKLHFKRQTCYTILCKINPCTGLDRSLVLQDVEAARVSRQSVLAGDNVIQYYVKSIPVQA